jgi:FkbM family methyltransferase
MKKIFLDFGANRLQGLHLFKEKLGIDSSWIIQSYEPNKAVYDHAKTLHRNRQFFDHTNFYFYNTAVSDCDSKEEIKNIIQAAFDGKTIDGDFGGSTLLKDNIWHQPNVVFKIETVTTVDVNNILDQIVLKYGQDVDIWIKCDIEGYEYKVIKRLLQSNHLKNIKQLYIEWHPHFFQNKEEKKKESEYLLTQLSKYNIEAHNHH